MINPKSYAFVDESGDASLKLESTGCSTHFIVAAILVKEESLTEAIFLAEKVRERHFSSSEMKSSGIGTNDERRIKILSELSALPISYYVFVADKREIRKDSGLIFKRPFIKFLSGKVYNTLFRTFPNLDVVADQHGNQEFMDGVKRYVATNHQPSLFKKDDPSFNFGDSKEHVLIQVADVVAGSIAKIFDENRKSENRTAILTTLRPNLAALGEWPIVFRNANKGSKTMSSDLDSMIRLFSHNTVSLYLSELSEDRDDEDRVREASLTYLLDQLRYGDEDRSISAAEIVAYLNNSGHPDISIHGLRSKVIAHFRDHGLIIGSDQNGYKIPTKVDDIIDYVKRCDAVMTPMIRRLKSARDQIKMTSHNELDILSDDRYRTLKILTDGLPKEP